MDNINKLKEMIEYIEENLTYEIKYKKLAKILCVSEYTLHRIFPFISNVSLSEYIRKRRLSKAILELKENPKIKIIDLAIKYQYDSAISFSRAFTKMQGFKPSEIKLHKTYIKNYPVLDFKSGFANEIEINFRIEDLPSQKLYGIYIECEINEIKNKAPIFWTNTRNNKYQEIFNDTMYGVIEYDSEFPDPKKAKYYIASSKKFENSVPILIPSSKWAVFKIGDNSGEYMCKYSRNIYANWIPYSEYNILPLPEIEKYYTDGTIEWYLPIE